MILWSSGVFIYATYRPLYTRFRRKPKKMDDLTLLWKDSDVVKAQPKYLSAVGIPKIAADYLIGVGLPRSIYNLNFSILDEPLLYLSEVSKGHLIDNIATGDYVVIGLAGFSPIVTRHLCINVVTGTIEMFSVREEWHLYVNRDLPAFMRCLYHFNADFLKIIVSKDRTDSLGDRYAYCANRLSDHIAQVENAVLNTENSYWKNIVFEVRTGGI